MSTEKNTSNLHKTAQRDGFCAHQPFSRAEFQKLENNFCAHRPSFPNWVLVLVLVVVVVVAVVVVVVVVVARLFQMESWVYTQHTQI